VNSDRCTYLGITTGSSLYCASATDAGRMCVGGQPNGSSCNLDRQCASGVCSSAGLCVISQPYPSPTTCSIYTKAADAQAE
jgi:hypothetical protein